MADGGCSPQVRSAMAAVKEACQPTSPARNWVLADKVEPQRCGLNQMVNVSFSGVDERDSIGRIAHIRGIFVECRAVVTCAGATNDAVSAYQVRGSVFKTLTLKDVTAWEYWSALDPRCILDDVFFRCNMRVNLPPFVYGAQGSTFPTILADNGIPQDAGTGTHVVDASVHLPLVAPRSESHSPSMGLIPLAAISNAQSGAFRFKMGPATLLGDTPDAPDGVVLTSFQRYDGTAGLNVWLDIVYLPSYVVDVPWQLEEYTLDSGTQALKHTDRRHEYAWIRFYPEDDFQSQDFGTGQGLCQAGSGYTFKIAGNTFADAFEAQEVITRMLLTLAADPMSAQARDNAAQDLPVQNADGALALPIVPYRGRLAAPFGALRVQYSTFDATNIRYMHRTSLCGTPKRGAALTAVSGIKGNVEVVGTNSMGNATPGAMDNAHPVLVVPTK